MVLLLPLPLPMFTEFCLLWSVQRERETIHIKEEKETYLNILQMIFLIALQTCSPLNFLKFLLFHKIYKYSLILLQILTNSIILSSIVAK